MTDDNALDDAEVPDDPTPPTETVKEGIEDPGVPDETDPASETAAGTEPTEPERLP